MVGERERVIERGDPPPLLPLLPPVHAVHLFPAARPDRCSRFSSTVLHVFRNAPSISRATGRRERETDRTPTFGKSDVRFFGLKIVDATRVSLTTLALSSSVSTAGYVNSTILSNNHRENSSSQDPLASLLSLGSREKRNGKRTTVTLETLDKLLKHPVHFLSIVVNQTCSDRERRNSRTKTNRESRHEVEARVGVRQLNDRRLDRRRSGSTTERKESGAHHRWTTQRHRLPPTSATTATCPRLRNSPPEREPRKRGVPRRSLPSDSHALRYSLSSPFSSSPSSSSPPPPLPDPRRRRGLLPWSSHSKLEREERRANTTPLVFVPSPFPLPSLPPFPGNSSAVFNQPSSRRLLVEARGISSLEPRRRRSPRIRSDWMQLVATLGCAHAYAHGWIAGTRSRLISWNLSLATFDHVLCWPREDVRRPFRLRIEGFMTTLRVPRPTSYILISSSP